MADGQLLAAAVDIDRWLRADRHTPYEQRLRRDRALGRELPAGGNAARVLTWWRRVERDREAPSPGNRVVQLRRLVSALLFALGVILGISVSSVAFAYDGSAPVNLLTLLGVLVALPGVLLLLSLLALPGWVPGVRGLGDLFAGLSPSRWAGVWLDRAGETMLFTALGTARRRSAFARWQLVTFSQLLAVGFFLGALLAAWFKVAFTDLAFGWSTTLRVDAGAVHGFFALLAAPWGTWLPDAAPDPELTEASRFVRLDGTAVSADEAVRLGDWWPFVLMVIVCYGLLPRLLLLALGAWRLRSATRRWLLDSPEVTALVDRLDSPAVAYDAEAEETPGSEVRAAAAAPVLPSDAATEAVIWNDAMAPDAAEVWLKRDFALAPGRIQSFATVQSASDWDRGLDRLGRELKRLVIVTKGWEPPLLEFLDFIELLRSRLGPDVVMVVVPVAVSGTYVAAQDREIWGAALGRLGDSGVYVMDASDKAAEAQA